MLCLGASKVTKTLYTLIADDIGGRCSASCWNTHNVPQTEQDNLTSTSISSDGNRAPYSLY